MSIEYLKFSEYGSRNCYKIVNTASRSAQQFVCHLISRGRILRVTKLFDMQFYSPFKGVCTQCQLFLGLPAPSWYPHFYRNIVCRNIMLKIPDI